MAHAVKDAMTLGGHWPDGHAVQQPADVAVVITTVLRPSLVKAVESIYAQDLRGRIQVLVGVDVAQGPVDDFAHCAQQRPANVSVTLLALPWSTSVRHGGVHTAMDGGSIRAMLSFMANAPLVAYLDDDNTWQSRHLGSMVEAVQGKSWAHSLRRLVDSDTGADLGTDQWDSVGVDKGRFASAGGFVDTNCLLVDKIKCCRALGRWAESGTGKPGLTADRNFFQAIRQAPHACTNLATVDYVIRPTNILHRLRREALSAGSPAADPAQT